MIASTRVRSMTVKFADEVTSCPKNCCMRTLFWSLLLIFSVLFGFATYVMLSYRLSFFQTWSGPMAQFSVQTFKAIDAYAEYLREDDDNVEDDKLHFFNFQESNCFQNSMSLKDAIIYLSTPSGSDEFDDDSCLKDFDDVVHGLSDDTDDDALQTTTAHIKCNNRTTLLQNVTDALKCLYDLNEDQDEGIHYCRPDDFSLLLSSESDTSHCGISTDNEQGCRAGFYQPLVGEYYSSTKTVCTETCVTYTYDDKGRNYTSTSTKIDEFFGDDEEQISAPYVAAKPCPPGYFCPKNFNCAFPCGWGGACLRSVGTGNMSCSYPYGLDSNKATKSKIYNQSVNFCDRVTDDHQFACPGASGMSLCPAGYYCPNPTTVIKCPKFYYCPKGFYKPIECTFKFICSSTNLSYPPVLAYFAEAGALFFAASLIACKITLLLHSQIKKRRRAHQLKDIQERAAEREKREEDEEIDAVETEVLEAAAEEEVDDPLGICCGMPFLLHVAIVALSLPCLLVGIVLVQFNDDSAQISGKLLMSFSVPMLTFGGLGMFLILRASGNSVVGALQLEKRYVDRTIEKRRESLKMHLEDVNMLGSIKTKKRTRVDIEVKELGLKLHSNGAMVLAGVTGKLGAGKVTALMGPSGAGKTTFLNTLSGRATYGTTTGQVLLNGKHQDINSISSIVGFVPQDDVMHRDLTVREVIKFYARLRLPRHFNAVVRERVIEDVIEALGLLHIEDSVIGDEAKRGISGGQRKRVNVGMEMVGDPSLLFLDEPTSGLDSTTSYDLISALSKLAKKGVNVIAVLHQPSYQLYAMFDRVLLLGNGGRTVFLGNSKDALGYFQGISFELPHMMNPADFMMDCIAGKCKRKGFPNFRKNDLFDLWKERLDKIMEESDALEADTSLPLLEGDIKANEGAGILRSIVIFAHRAAVQYTKTVDANIFDVFLCVGTGLFLGVAYKDVTLATAASSFLMFSFGLSLDIGLSSLRVFGDEKLTFWRETSPGAGMGLSASAFFIAKTIVEVPRLVILTLVNCFYFYAFAKSSCGFGIFFGVSLLLSWAVSGLAVAYSIAYDAKSAQLVLVITLLVFLLYGGVETTFDSMSNIEFIISCISPNRWLVEELTTCHTSHLSASQRLPYTWYKEVSDSIFAIMYKFSYSEELAEPAQISTSSRNTAAGAVWLYWNSFRSTSDVQNPGATLVRNSDGLFLNALINFWLGVVFRMVAFVLLFTTDREKLGKQSFKALFQQYVMNSVVDWITKVIEERQEFKASDDLSNDDVQMNPVIRGQHSAHETNFSVEPDIRRFDDITSIDMRQRGLTLSKGDTNETRGKSHSVAAAHESV